MLRRSLVTICVMGGLCAGAVAQGAFPAPLPNQSSPEVFRQGVPPVRNFVPSQDQSVKRDECLAKFRSLVEDARRRGAIVSNVMASKASARHTCNMVEAYVAAQMIIGHYAVEKQSACGLPADTITQLKARGAESQQLMSKICARAKDDPPSRFDPPPEDRPRRFDLPPTDQPRLGILRINTAPGL